MASTDDNISVSLEGESDSGSAFGDSNSQLSTCSIGSSVLQYRQENGRSYHAYKDGKYMYPNDEAENNRLDLSHHLFLLTFNNKLALAPIGNQIHRVLDVGTGTGIWAIDFAEEHPESLVLGVDLSPTQPQLIPPNCVFEVDDLDEEWTFKNKFELIHARMMNQGLSNWPQFFSQAFDNLSSGGFLEFQDSDLPLCCDDGTLPADCALSRWCSLMLEAGRRCGRPESVSPRCKSLMLEAGFIDVVELRFKWPTNRWPKDKKMKELGMWHEVNQEDGLEGATLAMFTRVLGWEPLQVQEFLVEVKKNTRDKSIHAYWPIYVVYGRKP